MVPYMAQVYTEDIVLIRLGISFAEVLVLGRNKWLFSCLALPFCLLRFEKSRIALHDGIY